MANPVNGSNERDFILFKLVSVYPTVAVVLVEANDPSDLAFTSRSIDGMRLCKEPPSML